MTFFTIATLCVVAFFINSMMNGWRLSIVKKECPDFETINDILSESHPIFNVVSALIMMVCPCTILIIAVTNVVSLL